MGADLLEILQFDDLGGDVFRFATPAGAASGRSDIFGGQVAAQALRAAIATTAEPFLPNSVHCYFLRRGRPDLPLDCHVGRVRDGRTYATRRVELRQDGKPVFTMLASFHAPEAAPTFEVAAPLGTPGPETVRPSQAPPAGPRGWAWRPVMEVRTLPTAPPEAAWWGRFPPGLPDDPAVHLCGLLYASDMQAGGVAMAAVGIPPSAAIPGAEARFPGNFGSLDHALWFHRVPTVDDWFLSRMRALQALDARGLVLGELFDAGGRPLATFVQEAFLKLERVEGVPGRS